MDILKTAEDWTKAEMLSSSYFVFFGVLFLVSSVGFWQIGKTDVARAYVWPTAVAGTLVLIIGIGIFVQSYGRLSSIPEAHSANAASFIAEELQCSSSVLAQNRVAVFKVIPLIVAACAILFVVLEMPILRASFATTIPMMAVLLLVDTNGLRPTKWRSFRRRRPNSLQRPAASERSALIAWRETPTPAPVPL